MQRESCLRKTSSFAHGPLTGTGGRVSPRSLRGCEVNARRRSAGRSRNAFLTAEKKIGASRRKGRVAVRLAWRFARSAHTAVGTLEIRRRSVFVEEMGSHASLAPLYGYSLTAVSESVLRSAQRNGGTNTTLLASMSLEGMGPCVWPSRAFSEHRALRDSRPTMWSTSWLPR